MATIRSLGFSIFTRYNGDGIRAAARDIRNFDTQIRSSTTSLNSWSGRIILAAKAAAVFAPALLPIAANLTAVAGAATAMAASVGVALGAYGLAVKNAISSTEAMAKAGKSLSESQKSYVKAMDAYKKALSTFGSGFRDETLKAVSATLRGMTNVLKGLEPVARALAPEVTKVAQAFEKWTQGGSFKNFVNLIKSSAVPIFRDLVAAGKDFLNVLGDGFRAFLPHGTSFAQTLRDGAAALKQWSDGGGFQRFLAYVRDTAPQVREFFRAFGDAIRNIGAIMKELAPFSLGLVTAILRLVAALPPAWIEAVVQAFVAWKVAVMGLMVLQGLVTLIRGLTVAWALFNAVFIASPIGLVVTAIIALVAAIVLLVKNWDTVSGALKTAWQATWNFLKQVAETVWNGLKAAWQAVCNFFSSIWSSVSGAISTAWSTVWNALKVAAEAVWNAIKTAWQAVCNFFSTAWSTVGGALSAAWSAVWNAIKTAAETVWNVLKAAWNAFIQGLQTIWSTVSGALSTAWNTVWNAIKTAAETVWNALRTAWNAFIQGLQTIWSTVSGALSTAWNTVWNAIKTAAEAVWNALRTAWNAFIQGLQTIWSTVSAALSTAWNTVWNAIRTVATAVWTALQTAWQVFLTAVQTIWNTVSAALRATWETIWNAIKTVAETIWNALKAAWEAFLNAIKTLWDTISAVLRTAWETIWNGIKTAAETIWNTLRTAWEAFLNWIRDSWDKAGDLLKSAWESVWNWLKETADKLWHEIGEIIEKAINAVLGLVKKVVGAWNSIAGAVGLDSLKIDTSDWSVDFNFAAGGVVEFANGGIAGGAPHFKAGGVLPGYAPGRDTVPAMLSRGEGILVPEAVQALGPDFVHWANFTFSHGRGGKNVAFPGYAKGGIMSGCAELPGYAGGGIVAFGRDPRNQEGWGTHFFQGGGVVDPDNPGVVGPGGIIIGGEASTSPDAADVKVGDGDPLGVGVLTGGIENMMKTGGMVLGFLGRAAIEKMFDFAISFLDNFGVAGDFGKMLAAGTKKVVMGMIDNLVKKDEEAKQQFTAMSVAGTQSVEKWAPMAAKALQIAGLDPSQLQRFLALMMAESGGNPNAFNGWDINARNGVPSQGLMQVIPTTFAAYRDPSLSNNILDPLANMVASARYIKARYGGQVPGSPYASGTTNATAGLHMVGENGPELVTSPGYANFGGGETVYNAADTASLLAEHQSAPQGIAASLKNRSFEEIIAAAKRMVANVKQSWGSVVASSTSGWSGLQPVLGDVATEYGSDIPIAVEAMRSTNAAAWADMGTQSALQWTTMRDGTYAEAEMHQGVTMPAATLAMQTANSTAWADMGTQSALQWTAMRDGTYAEASLMQTGTMPAASVAMQDASTTAWTGMTTTSTSEWTSMNQGAFSPLQTTMTTEVPGAAATMNNGVSTESRGMATNVISAVESTMGPVDSFIAKMDTAIAKASQAATAIRNVASGGGASGGSSNLEAIADDLGKYNDMLMAGGWTLLEDGTWTNSSGGTAAERAAADKFALHNDSLMAAGYTLAEDGSWISPRGYAIGTPGATGGTHLVGEQGPELINFQGGESVTPANDTARILAGMAAPITVPTAPASGMPEATALESPLMEQFGTAPEGEGWFGDIIAAAQHMMSTTQIAWDGTVAAGTTASPLIEATVNQLQQKLGVDLPASLEKMATSAMTNWTAMNVNSAAQWAIMRDTTFLEAETHQGTTMPAMSLAMQTAHDLAWTTMNATSLATWTVMRDVQYAEAELHLGTTMPQMAVAMQTAHDLAWTTMNATSLATWTIMRDTQYLEAETHMGTTMPQMAVTMQTAHDLAWTTMQATSLAQWTLIRDGQIVPFEEHMSVTMPEAATAMSEAVSAAFTTMVETIVAQLDTAIAKIEEFIAATEAAIAAAEALAAAQAAAAASGGGGGGGSLGAASGSAEAALAAAGISPGMIVQGPYSNSVAASAGTHSGGGVYDIAGGPELLPALHAAGFAAWYRDWPGNQHIHAVYSGATDLSPQAQWQLEDFRRGGSGLNIPVARGINSAPAGWAWVGEAGPELMRMRGGEEVMPNSASEMYASAVMRNMRRRRGWNPKKSRFFRSEGGRREFTSLMEANAGSVRGSVSDGGGINVEFNFNGPVSNGEDVRRAVDEAIPRLRTALQAGTGRRTGG